MSTTECGTIPFTADSLGRARKIVFTPKKITVELVVRGSDGDNLDVTGQLTRDELQDVLHRVNKARQRHAAEDNDQVSEAPAKPVVVVTDAMVAACYNHPEGMALPSNRMLMKETLERALRSVDMRVVDLPYLHLHARFAGDYLMKAKGFLKHHWTGALDEALDHIDYVKVALEPYTGDEPRELGPDYKDLFNQAMRQLTILSGSRNSLTSDATARLFDMDQPHISLRTPAVEAMHREAVEFLNKHKHLAEGL